ncbi:mCG1030968, partial [Mus musculus]
DQGIISLQVPDYPQQGGLPSLELTPTKVHIYRDARETRTLLNCSLHYPLFLRGVKKPTLLSRKPVRVTYIINKHQSRASVKEIYRNLKTPHSRLKTSNSPHLHTPIHYPSPLVGAESCRSRQKSKTAQRKLTV